MGFVSKSFRVAALAIGCSLFAAPAALGETYVVDDTGAATGAVCTNPAAPPTCSLPQAIGAANATAEADTITFIPYLATINLGALPGPRTIGGGGALTIAAEPGDEQRVDNASLEVTSGSLEIARMNFHNPAISPSNPTIKANQNTVSVTDSTLWGGLSVIVTNGALTVTRSMITNGRTTLGGGGGGIQIGASGNVNVTGSTLSSNLVAGAGLGGGAIYNAGVLNVTNSTLEGNAVNGGPLGSAIDTFDGGGTASTTLNSVTVSQNSGSSALYNGEGDGAVSLTNSIVGSSIDSDCGGFAFDSGGNNMRSNSADVCLGFDSPGDLVVDMEIAAEDPASALLPVFDTFGLHGPASYPHPYRPLLAGSPAINTGGSCPATDQRGLLRAAAPPCDRGAIETGATATLPPPPNTTATTPTPPRKCKKKGKKKGKKAKKKCKKKRKKRR